MRCGAAPRTFRRGASVRGVSFDLRHVRRGAAPRTFRRGASVRGVSFDLRHGAPRSGTKSVPTRSVGTRAFVRFTACAPRSGTKSVPTRSVGTRAFVRFTAWARAERHKVRSDAERRYEGFRSSWGGYRNREVNSGLFLSVAIFHSRSLSGRIPGPLDGALRRMPSHCAVRWAG